VQCLMAVVSCVKNLCLLPCRGHDWLSIIFYGYLYMMSAQEALMRKMHWFSYHFITIDQYILWQSISLQSVIFSRPYLLHWLGNCSAKMYALQRIIPGVGFVIIVVKLLWICGRLFVTNRHAIISCSIVCFSVVYNNTFKAN